MCISHVHDVIYDVKLSLHPYTVYEIILVKVRVYTCGLSLNFS
jgi:hypothetical protein